MDETYRFERIANELHTDRMDFPSSGHSTYDIRDAVRVLRAWKIEAIRPARGMEEARHRIWLRQTTKVAARIEPYLQTSFSETEGKKG
jgi:hypothetical protein